MALRQSSVKSQKQMKYYFLLFTFHFSLFTLLVGCASLSQKENILAIVDDEPIIEEDLKYSLQIAHRREDLSSAGSLDLLQYVQKLIDDRLIVDEARRMGMEQFPEVQQAVRAFILRESVTRLHNEEILQKVSLSEEIQGVKEERERLITKQKQKEREVEFTNLLRKQATVKINQEILSNIKNRGIEVLEKGYDDKMPLVEVYDSVLTVADFAAAVESDKMGRFNKPRMSYDDIINRWIDFKLIDHEALSRHYEMRPDLKGEVYRYKNQLLKNTYIKRIIIPGIVITDKIMEDYYLKNQRRFVRPARFKVQHITLKSMEDAQRVLDNLKNGADFLWLAKSKLSDPDDQKGWDLGWLSRDELPEPIRGIIDTLKPGDISPVFKTDSLYRIIRLQAMTEQGVEEFDKVKEAVKKACFEEQYNNLLNVYVAKLKEDAQIKIFEDTIHSFEEKMKK